MSSDVTDVTALREVRHNFSARARRCFVTAYVFVRRGNESVLLQFNRSNESDDEFSAIVDAMIKSVKVVKS